MPNSIAFLALAVFPVVVVALYRRLPADRALIWSLLLGYLFLPEPPAVFDLPLMPPFNKHNIPVLAAFMVAHSRYGKQESILPQSGVGKLLMLTFIFSPIITVVANHEPVFFGRIGLPGLGAKDAVALTLQQFLLVLPFLMARQHLQSGGALRDIAMALMIGGLVYSLLMLVEIRLSPQVNQWVYGYFQHSFVQTLRFGGYRPMVFLYHGIWVAFFTMSAVVSAYALWRYEEGGAKWKLFFAALYLTAILVLAKSLGSLVFMVLLVPMVVLLSTRQQVRIAIVIASLALAYPILKGADLVPQEKLLAQAASIDPQRAGSLQFRFDNENILLDRAYIKPIFGWGSWGRNHILDPINGNIVTVTDGRWIIVIGVYGWVGFIAEFGLLLLPILLVGREVKFATPALVISPMIGPLSLLLAINALDMLPNATLTPLTWLLAGALTGYAENLRSRRLRGPEQAPSPRRKPMM